MFKYVLAGALSLVAAVPASAATFLVDAEDHSINSGSGTGLATGLFYTLGDVLTVSSSTDDLWSAGALPRFSDGSGLVGDRFATAADDSGQPVGTQIGTDFGMLNVLGFSAPYGSLVGRYDDGTFQLFGANFSGAAAGTGQLSLFYWDTFTGDNFGDITFDVSAAVPEPATWAMLLIGFGLVGGALRRRAQGTARIRFT
jgi:hypothetical protein